MRKEAACEKNLCTEEDLQMNCCYRHDREPVKNEEVMRSNLHQLTEHFLLIFGLPPGCEPRNNQQYST